MCGRFVATTDPALLAARLHAVDETGQRGAPVQLVHLRAGSDAQADRLVAADRHQPVALDRECFGHRMGRILGEQASPAQDPIGGAQRRSGHRGLAVGGIGVTCSNAEDG